MDDAQNVCLCGASKFHSQSWIELSVSVDCLSNDASSCGTRGASFTARFYETIGEVFPPPVATSERRHSAQPGALGNSIVGLYPENQKESTSGYSRP